MLKKCLLGLFVGFVGFIGFGYCDTVSSRMAYSGFVKVTKGSIHGYFNSGSCIYFDSTASALCTSVSFYNLSGDLIREGWKSASTESYRSIKCVDFDGYLSLDNSERDGTCYYNFFSSSDYPYNQECEECQDCPEIDTGSILSGACDTNYCVQNDLCPSSSGSRSELMINNIVHEGKPLINISIPDNIYWDYATDDNQFDLYVGSGYNQDYIDSVLAINSYRPDNKDFTNIFVSGLTLIFPYIFVALLIVFIWKLLKRIFK